MPALKVGLIGCGPIARLVHLNILTHLSNVELVALAETDPQRREGAHRRSAPGVLAFTDYQELLAVPEVEAVVICLPNSLHAEAAVSALQRGKHIYLEKPLAMSLNEARSVLAAWQHAAVVGMIGFNYRFNALYQAAREHIRSGKLGDLVGVRSVFSTRVRPLPAWKQSRQSGGGVLLNLASHHIDLVHFLFGEKVCEAFAELRSQCSEDDSAALQLRLSNGLLVQSFFSMSAVDDDRFEVYGQAGKLTVDRYLSLDVEITDPTRDFSRLKLLKRGLKMLAYNSYLREKVLAPSNEPSYRVALSHFVAAALAKRPASPDFWDGYRSLAVIEAAEESARTGRMVSLGNSAYEDPTR
jgi:myo-inositol 2-dehydrogenase/D-chiro-inositol 1-dehydrogenase